MCSGCGGISDLRIGPRILLDLEDYLGESSTVLDAHRGDVAGGEDDAENGLFYV